MPSVRDVMSGWARKATAWFPKLRLASWGRDLAGDHCDGLTYRLRHWPDLPSHSRTVDMYRALSMMSHRPVNRLWLLTRSGLHAEQVDSLLRRLVDEGAVEVIDAPDS